MQSEQNQGWNGSVFSKVERGHKCAYCTVHLWQSNRDTLKNSGSVRRIALISFDFDAEKALYLPEKVTAGSQEERGPNVGEGDFNTDNVNYPDQHSSWHDSSCFFRTAQTWWGFQVCNMQSVKQSGTNYEWFSKERWINQCVFIIATWADWCLDKKRDLNDGTGAGSDTGPQIGALLTDGAGNGRSLHLTLGVDDDTGVV